MVRSGEQVAPYSVGRACASCANSCEDTLCTDKDDTASCIDGLLMACMSLIGEGQKATPGRVQDRKCHDRESLSRPLVFP